MVAAEVERQLGLVVVGLTGHLVHRRDIDPQVVVARILKRDILACVLAAFGNTEVHVQLDAEAVVKLAVAGVVDTLVEREDTDLAALVHHEIAGSIVNAVVSAVVIIGIEVDRRGLSVRVMERDVVVLTCRVEAVLGNAVAVGFRVEREVTADGLGVVAERRSVEIGHLSRTAVGGRIHQVAVSVKRIRRNTQHRMVHGRKRGVRVVDDRHKVVQLAGSLGVCTAEVVRVSVTEEVAEVQRV